MLKKILLGYVAIAVTVLVVINIYKLIDEHANKLSDQEMMEQYIECVLGDDCHGELLPDDGDEYVEFVIYDDAKDRIVHDCWCFERNYFNEYIE